MVQAARSQAALRNLKSSTFAQQQITGWYLHILQCQDELEHDLTCLLMTLVGRERHSQTGPARKCLSLCTFQHMVSFDTAQ